MRIELSVALIFLLSALRPFDVSGQAEIEKHGFFANWKLKPVAAAQFWGSYTKGARLFDRDSMTYEDVDGRLNFVLRRTRLGGVIQPSENITLNLIVSMDNVGRDVLAGAPGGANNANFPNVGLWHAFAKWRVIPGSEALGVVVGYHTPNFSRESHTPFHSVSSFDKSISQFYIRRHLVGKNPGRSPGVSMGGLVRPTEKFGIQYTAGIFNSIFGSALGNTAGLKSSALVTGRVVFFFGDPEADTWKVGHRFNTLGKRNGLSIGVSGAYEGTNDLFESSNAFALDAQYNHGGLNLAGEVAFLNRDGSRVTEEDLVRTFTTSSVTGYGRASYNIGLKDDQLMEIAATYMFFEGPKDEEDIIDALSVASSGGSNDVLDIAAIWHYVPGRLKLEAHYAFQTGESGGIQQGVAVNDFFTQNGLSIEKGNYAGLALIFVL